MTVEDGFKMATYRQDRTYYTDGTIKETISIEESPIDELANAFSNIVGNTAKAIRGGEVNTTRRLKGS